MPNQELAEDLHKAIIRIFEKRKIYSSFKDHTQGSDLADVQLINKYNKGSCFLLSNIWQYSKSAWVVLLKGKKGVTSINAFEKFLHEYNRKPNIIWVNKGREFYCWLMKSWLQDNDVEIYSTHNEDMPVVPGLLKQILLMEGQAQILTSIRRIIRKILNLKLVIS